MSARLSLGPPDFCVTRRFNSDIQKCKMACLDSDAFGFPGASQITTVNIQANEVLALPEALLWNLSSLQFFEASSMPKLRTVPERFFLGQSKLERISFTGSANLGAEDRLPDGLFEGLTSLRILHIGDCGYQNLPNMDDLAVRATCCQHLAGTTALPSVCNHEELP